LVVYLHGLWLHGHESLLLRRHLESAYGFDLRVFHYPSVSAPMAEVTARLQAFIADEAPQELHLVGHSLGGLIAYRFLERYPQQPPGRVVFLGTPALASRAARDVGRAQWARTLLGRCVAEELLTEQRREWSNTRDLGIIAGTRALGLGRLVVRFGEANDGSVAVSETRLPGARDHITLPVSHMGMLLSARVARETGGFLAHGYFSHHAATSASRISQ
jgi:pimeloyl-ACP methyl ester carboxylesterase